MSAVNGSPATDAACLDAVAVDRSEKVTLQHEPNMSGTSAAPHNAPMAGDGRAEGCPQLALTKLWMHCGPRARREFLADILASDPALWREVTEAGR
jgi:hypothetical protein